MTKLERHIRRQLPQEIDRRQYVVDIGPAGVVFRQLHTRQGLPLVDWSSIFDQACRLSAEQKRIERQQARLTRH